MDQPHAWLLMVGPLKRLLDLSTVMGKENGVIPKVSSVAEIDKRRQLIYRISNNKEPAYVANRVFHCIQNGVWEWD